MIKAIIFDLDNTLIDRQAAAYAMYKQFVSELFKDLSPDDYAFESIVQDLMTWDEFGSINKQHPLTMLCNKYGLDLGTVDLFKDRWTKEFSAYTVLYPETIDVIIQLKKKFHLGMITNGNSFTQWQKIKKVNIESYFDQIIVSGDYGVHKPDPSIFDAMCKKLSLNADECLFVGDTFSADIVGAHHAGMDTVWICGDLKRAAAPWIKRIYTLKELLAIV